VILPTDAGVQANVQVRGGESHVLGRVERGVDADQVVRDVPAGATGTIALDAELGFGVVEVCRAAPGAVAPSSC
jgi:hypothetical protein